MIAGWGSLKLLANKDTLSSDSITMARVIIRQGEANPKHRHPNCYELLHLLKGRLEYFIADERVEMSPGDTILIPTNIPHYGNALSEEDAEMIVAFNSGVREFVPEP